MKLTKNFRLAEFLASDIASRRGYSLIADAWITEQIERLAKTIMQPIRTELSVPIVITSGYRPAWLNEWVNGSTRSMHLFGCACDWKPVGMTMPMAFKRVQDMSLPIDQCVLEHPPDGWIHTGQALPGKLSRNQFMVAERIGGRTVYSNA
jgi:hypothetical protein